MDSFFGRQGGSFITRVFRLGLLGKIGMTVGAPVLPQNVTPDDLRARVLAMRGDWR